MFQIGQHQSLKIKIKISPNYFSLNMDHQYSQHNSLNEDVPDIMYEEYIGKRDIENTIVNINVPEKVDDNYLIQLYRERRFLYDKSHRDFKDNELKNNAWKEISSIMKDKNFGKYKLLL